jgi:hypothetical protein
MGKSIPIHFEHLSFNSKKQAQDYFREILHRNPLGADLTGQDHTDVMALLTRHPKFNEKQGCGILALLVDRDDSPNGRCFHLRRTDGTTDNFSFPQCLDGAPSARTRFMKAARFAIQSDVTAFREQVFNDQEQCFDGFVRCAKTGTWVSSANAHIDHAEPLTFSRIVRDFISIRNINLDEFSSYLHQGLYGCFFSDSKMIEDFRQYHAEVAVLQVVTKESNLKDSWKGHLDRETETTTVAV